MTLDPKTRRMMSAAYILSKHRAEAKARKERDQLVDRFEELNEATLSEIRELRSELVHAHMIEDAMAERAEHGPWLH
jgi:hypothetical protein